MEAIKDPFSPALPLEVGLTQWHLPSGSFLLRSEVTLWITTSVNLTIHSVDGRWVTAVMLCTLWHFHCAWIHKHSSFSVTGRKERKLGSAPFHPLLWEMKYGSLQSPQVVFSPSLSLFHTHKVTHFLCSCWSKPRRVTRVWKIMKREKWVCEAEEWWIRWGGVKNATALCLCWWWSVVGFFVFF